jgi:hypothetical protein
MQLRVTVLVIIRYAPPPLKIVALLLYFITPIKKLTIRKSVVCHFSYAVSLFLNNYQIPSKIYCTFRASI